MTLNQRPRAPAPSRDSRPASPCISVCTLDDGNCCLGCGRTLEQIGRWALMSKQEQWAVIDELRGRSAGREQPQRGG